jgi:hypothetical protein
LAPNDFWLFPKIKSASKGKKISGYWRHQENVAKALKAIP